MNYFAPGVNALAIFEENSGTVYHLDGSKISTASTLEMTRIHRASAKGTIGKIQNQVMMEVMHSDASLHAAMEAGDHNVKQWQFVVAGFSDFVVCYDLNTFAVEETPQFNPISEDYPFRIRYELQASPKSANGANLLSAYLRAQGTAFWADSNADEIADGFSLVSATNPNFNAGEQSFDGGATTSFELLDIPFPIRDGSLTLSYDVVAAAGDINNSKLEASTFAGAVSVSSDELFSGVGRKNQSLVLPSDAFYISLQIENFGSGAYTLADPIISINGNTVYNSY